MLLAKLLKQLKEKNINLKDFELQYIVPTVEYTKPVFGKKSQKEKVVEFELKFLRKEVEE